jgi:O-antigen/teichoic acid export membrane protein
MKKFDKVRILKNLGSSWFALGLNICVGVFLSPFILHHLGDAAFGLWILIFSVTGIMGYLTWASVLPSSVTSPNIRVAAKTKSWTG